VPYLAPENVFLGFDGLGALTYVNSNRSTVRASSTATAILSVMVIFTATIVLMRQQLAQSQKTWVAETQNHTCVSLMDVSTQGTCHVTESVLIKALR
jgi:hypothetical protein